MPLQHLVEYFNDRLGREHPASFRSFILEEGKVVFSAKFESTALLRC